MGNFKKATVINTSWMFVHVSSNERNPNQQTKKTKRTHNVEGDEAYPVCLDLPVSPGTAKLLQLPGNLHWVSFIPFEDTHLTFPMKWRIETSFFCSKVFKKKAICLWNKQWIMYLIWYQWRVQINPRIRDKLFKTKN